MRNDADINKDYGLMGFRIPAIAVSPYVRRGHVAHTTYGFESILKMIEYRFGLAPLNTRDAYAQQHRALVRLAPQAAARPPRPAAPRARRLGSRAWATPAARDAVRAHEHDLMDLVTSGYLDRLGLRLQAGVGRVDVSASRRSC